MVVKRVPLPGVSMTTRRTLLAGLGFSVCVLPWRAALAQSKAKRIGVLSGGRGPVAVAGQVPPHAFLVGMREMGYVEGRDFVVEWRYAEGRYELLGPFADELVRSEVDVIVALNTRGAQEAQRATKTIPIVFASISDPSAAGSSRILRIRAATPRACRGDSTTRSRSTSS